MVREEANMNINLNIYVMNGADNRMMAEVLRVKLLVPLLSGHLLRCILSVKPILPIGD